MASLSLNTNASSQKESISPPKKVKATAKDKSVSGKGTAKADFSSTLPSTKLKKNVSTNATAGGKTTANG